MSFKSQQFKEAKVSLTRVSHLTNLFQGGFMGVGNVTALYKHVCLIEHAVLTCFSNCRHTAP